MAQPIGQRQRQRAPIKPRRQFLPEATAAAQATGEILTNRFGPQAWIDQVAQAVQNAVQNGIENLSGTAISVNAHPEDGYRFRARTKEEIIQSAALVPKVNPAALPPPDDDATHMAPAQAPPPKAKKPEGWIL